MKITDIKTYPVWIGHRNQLLVKVETDEGIYGWGESGLSGRELAVVGAVRHYREWLLGADPMRRGSLWQDMYRSQYFEGGRVLTAAISAIDIALHDLAGKALGVPVHQLLGGKQREYIPCFATTAANPLPTLMDNVENLVAEGWTVIRVMHAPRRDDVPDGDGIFEPRESIAVTAERMVAIRERFGSDLVLGTEYHHRLSVAEAAAFCQRMPSGTLDFIEEPIRAETPEAYEALRRMTDVPFAIGEEFSSKWAFAPYLERGITDFARIDVCNVGGLTESMKVAGSAESHYIDVMPHNPLGPICAAATVHLSAAISNFAWMEVRASPAERRDTGDSSVFPMQVVQDGPRLIVPDGPGLGVEVDERALGRDEFRFWEAPKLRRKDGSVTNW